MAKINKFRNAPKDKRSLSPLDHLKSTLKPLIGKPFPLSGKPKTDGSRLRRLVSETLERAGLPASASPKNYVILPPKKKGVPRILIDLVDTYLVTTGESYNLQVWNRIPNSKSMLVQYTNSDDAICNNDVRYILVKITDDKIDAIAILSADYIEKRFGIFGKPTVKYQLLIPEKNRTLIIASANNIKYIEDTPNVNKISTCIFVKPDLNISDTPIASKVFSLEVIHEKVAKHLIGVKIDANDTKTRGQALEKKVAELLGYKVDGKLVGGYPDLPNQLLEVKIQDAQTIDLGKYTPEHNNVIYKELDVTTSDIRYFIALTNPKTNIIEGIVLMPGKALGEYFTYVSDSSYKCQRSIPMDFFSSIQGQCVINPKYKKPL